MSGGPSIHMPIYWGDYLRDTGHLSAAEHGAYLLLLGHYWTTGRPLPDAEDALRRIARMDPKEWARSRSTVRAFFKVGGGEWRHKRVDAELKRATEIYAKRVGAARKRWADAKPDASDPPHDDPPGDPLEGAGDDPPGHAHAYPKLEQPQPHCPSDRIDDDEDGCAGERARSKFDAATERVIEAAGADPDKQAGWMTASATVQKWLGHGADLELDVLPAIAAAMVSRRGRGPPNSPSYFDRPVLEARERRLAPLPDVTVAPIDGARNGSRKPNDFADRQHALDAGLAAAALRRLAPIGG